MKYGLSNTEAIEAIKKNYPPENYSVLREALDMAIEALELTRWIPVSERLPAKKDAKGINFKILVLFSNGVVDLWNPILVNEHFDLQIKHTYITHWMPLPEPPQEVE